MRGYDVVTPHLCWRGGWGRDYPTPEKNTFPLLLNRGGKGEGQTIWIYKYEKSNSFFLLGIKLASASHQEKGTFH